MKTNIKKLRKEKGVTQEKLCKIINIAQPTLSGYETNKFEPDFITASKLADYFDVTIDYLLGRSDYINEKKLPAEAESYVEYIQTHGIAGNIEEQKKLIAKINNLSPEQQKLIIQMIDNFKDSY